MFACTHIVSLLTLAVAGGGLAVIAAETVRLEEEQVYQNVEGVSVGLSGFIAIYSLRYRCSYCSQGHLGPVVSMACDSTSTLLATGWLQPLLELYTIHFPTSPDMYTHTHTHTHTHTLTHSRTHAHLHTHTTHT